ncbi:MAG: oligopeptide transporter, OPT family, partial [Bacteroidota bacterium]
VFGAMGLAAVWELFKNTNGIQFVKDSGKTFVSFAESKIEILGEKFSYSGGFLFESPAASPMLAGVGFIVGPRISSVLFAGSVIGWLLLVPIGIFLNPDLNTLIESGRSWLEIGEEIWLRQVRPLAVGTMIVASFYTLYNMRSTLMIGITKAFGDIGKVKASSEAVSRVDRDLNFGKVFGAIIAMGVPVFLLYLWFSGSVGGSIALTILMIIIGFLFAAVAGYLVGLVGSSNNPISGLTLSSLLIAALLVVFIGVTGSAGIAAVLGVAGVVCCAAGVSGDMMQDLKVGHLLGGTPWKMQVSEIIGVIVAALVLALPMQLMHEAYVIGSVNLPAPQAGLMALMAQGIVGGEMAWQLVVAGMFFAIALILIKAPSPMLIAVGMYLPFSSTGAIFVGGIIRATLDRAMQKKNASAEEKRRAENTGILLSSGFIAGESLMAVALAVLFGAISYFELDFSLTNFGVDSPSALLGMLVFIGLLYMLVSVPMRVARSSK